jgi:predicted carbohydrate-binding protein with CBM5 and CBM33 domain
MNDAIGPWPKHPAQRVPTSAQALHASQTNGRRRQSATQKRLVRMDGEVIQLGKCARRLQVTPSQFADWFRDTSIQHRTWARAEAWAAKVRAKAEVQS